VREDVHAETSSSGELQLVGTRLKREIDASRGLERLHPRRGQGTAEDGQQLVARKRRPVEFHHLAGYADGRRR
jgi:hypothetical protein